MNMIQIWKLFHQETIAPVGPEQFGTGNMDPQPFRLDIRVGDSLDELRNKEGEVLVSDFGQRVFRHKIVDMLHFGVTDLGDK